MSLLVIVVHYTCDKQISRNSCLCAHRMPARNELTRSATLQKQTPGVCSLFTGPQLVFKRLKWLFTSCGGVVVTATSFFHRHLWRNRVETKTATGEKKTSFRYHLWWVWWCTRGEFNLRLFNSLSRVCRPWALWSSGFKKKKNKTSRYLWTVSHQLFFTNKPAKLGLISTNTAYSQEIRDT